jgi:outer membrane biosynthesis protein TonB
MPGRGKLDATALAIALVCALSPVLMTGCGEKTVKAAAPVAAAPAPEAADSKPLTNIAPDTDALPPAENVPAPPNPVSVAAAPLPVAPAPSKPAPPARKQPAESAGDAQAEQPARTPAPQISPQLSPGDQASLQHKTEDDIGVAQKNLQQSSGRVLSAAQHDLVDKIQSFLSQSTEASKAGDWARAQNLSQKARLLSVELVDSL